jgi:aspartate kinase
MLKVFKFGGASVKDPAAIHNVATILSRFPKENLLVVVSAMGKTTNKLEEIVRAYQKSEEHVFMRLVQELEDFHLEILHCSHNKYRHYKE